VKFENAHISLMMIVKNETKTLPRLIESVLPLVKSWRIIDTGSTDGTQDLIQELLGHLPGELIERPWVNFGHNRSELVAKFHPAADFGLLLDADQIVEFDEDIWSSKIENADTYQLKVFEGNLLYRMSYLVKARAGFKYVGATHEALDANFKMKRVSYDKIWIRHVGDGGAKADKFERDERLLLEEVAARKATARTYFYLAQTQATLKKNDAAIANYENCIRLTRWDEEKFVSYLRSGRILISTDPERALEYFKRGNQIIPSRIECAYEAAKILADKKEHLRAVEILSRAIEGVTHNHTLFVESWIVSWGAQMQLGVSQWWSGDKQSAKASFEKALLAEDLTDWGRKQLQTNLDMC
jgi:tetratricopeptide (TPR) repeat protein